MMGVDLNIIEGSRRCACCGAMVLAVECRCGTPFCNVTCLWEAWKNQKHKGGKRPVLAAEEAVNDAPRDDRPAPSSTPSKPRGRASVARGKTPLATAANARCPICLMDWGNDDNSPKAFWSARLLHKHLSSRAEAEELEYAKKYGKIS